MSWSLKVLEEESETKSCDHAQRLYCINDQNLGLHAFHKHRAIYLLSRAQFSAEVKDDEG